MSKKTIRQRLHQIQQQEQKMKQPLTPVQKITPYDTGKLKIGVYYVPPKQKQSDEDVMLQSLLLGDKTPYMPQFTINGKYILYTLIGVVFYITATALTSR